MASTAESPCDDCGIPVRKRRRSDRAHLCRPCGVERNRKWCTELAEKNGPSYDAWRAKMLHWLEGESESKPA